MYFLSLVGISLASPSNSSQRLSKRCTSWMNGTFKCRPGAVDEAAHRPAELGEDGLLGLARRCRRTRTAGAATTTAGDDDGQRALHGFTSVVSPSSWRRGRTPLAFSSRITLRPELGQQLRHRLEVDALARHRRRLAVLLVERLEALGVALGVVDALERVALGRAHGLLGLALGPRHRLVVVGPGVVDGALLLLDGLVHLVEGGLHRVGRVHVLEHELLDLDADPVEVAQPLQLLLGLQGDRLAADGDDLVHAVVAHHLAHGRLRHVAEGLGHVAHVEEELARVLDAVLDDPLDHRHVQVAGEHHAPRRASPAWSARTRCAMPARTVRKPNSILSWRCTGTLVTVSTPNGILKCGPGLGGAHVRAEPLHHAHLVGLDLVVAGEQKDEDGDRDHDQPHHSCARLQKRRQVNGEPAADINRSLTPAALGHAYSSPLRPQKSTPARESPYAVDADQHTAIGIDGRRPRRRDAPGGRRNRRMLWPVG